MAKEQKTPRIEQAPDSNIFPVRKPPPESHFWPKTDQKKRRMEQQVRHRGREIIAAAPHLAELKYRPMLLSLCRITILIERAYSAIAEDDNLMSATTGELRGSLGTLTGLISQQTKLLNSLGLSPTVINKVTEKPVKYLDLASFRAEDNDDAKEQ